MNDISKLVYDPTRAQSPRLGELVKRVADLFAEFDVMGAVCVADENAAEFFVSIDPGFSVISVGRLEADGGMPVRIRAKVSDYPSREACHAAVQSTCSALVDFRGGLQQVEAQCSHLLAVMGQHVEMEVPDLQKRGETEQLVEGEIPANVTAALAMLTRCLSEEQLAAIADVPLDEFLTHAAATFGVQLEVAWRLSQLNNRLVVSVLEAYPAIPRRAHHVACTLEIVLATLWLAARKAPAEECDRVMSSVVQTLAESDDE